MEQLIKEENGKQDSEEFIAKRVQIASALVLNPKVRFADMVLTNYHGDIKWMEESVDNVREIIKGCLIVCRRGRGRRLQRGLRHCRQVRHPLLPRRTDQEGVDHGGRTRQPVLLQGLHLEWLYAVFLEIHPLDPRSILQGVVNKGVKMGFTVDMFSELEFYLTDFDGKPNDMGTYICVPPEDGCQ